MELEPAIWVGLYPFSRLTSPGLWGRAGRSAVDRDHDPIGVTPPRDFSRGQSLVQRFYFGPDQAGGNRRPGFLPGISGALVPGISGTIVISFGRLFIIAAMETTWSPRFVPFSARPPLRNGLWQPFIHPHRGAPFLKLPWPSPRPWDGTPGTSSNARLVTP